MSGDDDDWFERALREGTGADDRADDAGDPTDADDVAEAGDPAESADAGTDATTGPRGVRADAPPGGGGESTGDDPFGEDFASAIANAPDPAADRATEAAGGDPEAGDAKVPGSFDPSATDLDSDIDRISIGIDGLDEMILGGVPARSLLVAIGSAGTGKTTFGLQFLEHALAAGDRAIYITLEESRESVLETADEKGWGFSDHVAAGRLAVVDFDPLEMVNSLSSIGSELPGLVESFGAERLVLDSVSLLEMMYDHPARRRGEVFEFARELKEAGVTTMVTSEASEGSAYASRYGVVEYLADAVFVLRYVRPSDLRETRLAVEIQKVRDANHSRETKPYEITDQGISVHGQANIF